MHVFSYWLSYYFQGVMLAVEACVNALKDMSRTVTTPEEIAQVHQCVHY